MESLEVRRLLAVAAEVADLNDDGFVNYSDLGVIFAAYNAPVGVDTFPEVEGLQGYLEGLDLNFDGTSIGFGEFMEIFGNWGATGVPISPTSLTGRVFDNHGNPLPGVTVELDGTGLSAVSDEFGIYNIDEIPTGSTGFQTITFDGSGAEDPTPGVGSGQFPSIPHKPIFINGGTEVRFRDLPLPERDLTGSIDLRDPSIASMTGANEYTLSTGITYKNGGVSMSLPTGSVVTFPDGEDPVLSITRVDPARLPIPMPPDLSSTLFVTYQPGGTVVSGPGPIITEFDNTDLYLFDTEEPANNTLNPGLAGVTDGVFTKIGTTEILDADNDSDETGDPDDILRATVPTPFEFAWYHVDIINPVTPRTTVRGQVKLFTGVDIDGNLMGDPVSGAMASIPGVGPVPTDADGFFNIFNVPSAPNGIRGIPTNPAFSPFNIRASASKDLDDPLDGLQFDEVGSSDVVPAVPGGITDVGMIFLGVPGGAVNGRLEKLTSLSPFLVQPLADQLITFEPAGLLSASTSTDAGGNYNFSNVPVGSYEPFSINGTDIDDFPKTFFDSNPNDTEIDGAGDLDVHDFKSVGIGSVKVTVVDVSGSPVPDAFVEVFRDFEEALGGGFVSPDVSCFDLTDANGMILCEEAEGYGGYGGDSGVPIGDFDVNVFSGLGSAFGSGSVNQEGEQVEITITIETPGDIRRVEFINAFSDPEGAPSEILFTDVFYYSDVQSATAQGAQLELLIEWDSIPNLGSSSEIDNDLNPPSGSTTLDGEVDFRTRCFVDVEGGFCAFEDSEGVEIGFGFVGFGLLPGGEIDGSHLIIPTPTDIIGNSGNANVAVASVFLPQIDEALIAFGITDVVPGDLSPETGGAVVVPLGIGSDVVVVDDPASDTFLPQQPELNAESSDASLPSNAILDSVSLGAAVQSAIGQWATTGLTVDQQRTLESIPVRIVDLPGSMLGLAPYNRIYIDRDAAGVGWYLGDSAPPANRFDLTTALTHEFGHILGIGHDHGNEGGVMAPFLQPGVRSLLNSPGSATLEGERGSSIDSESLSPLVVGQSDGLWQVRSDRLFTVLGAQSGLFALIDERDLQSQLLTQEFSTGTRLRSRNSRQDADHRLFDQDEEREYDEDLIEALMESEGDDVERGELPA